MQFFFNQEEPEKFTILQLLSTKNLIDCYPRSYIWPVPELKDELVLLSFLAELGPQFQLPSMASILLAFHHFRQNIKPLHYS